MIFCKELNKEFADKAAMFAELKANKEQLIGLKKAAFKHSDPVHFNIKPSESSKALANEVVIGIGSTIYPVINTTNYYDSHGDVHLDDIWNVSVKDNKGKLYYVMDHDLSITSVVAYPKEVDPYVQSMAWTELGLPYPGNTQALIFKVLLTEATNKSALGAIVNKAPLQNSVRMQYIDMILCIDDTSEGYEQECANFYKYLAVIANKQDALDAGYFWAIPQAKIVREGSVVLFGSNDATPILYLDPITNKLKKAAMDDMSSNDKNYNIEFIDKMVPHHEMALKMIKDFKGKLTDVDLKAIAKSIKTSQTEQIAEMNKIKNNLKTDPVDASQKQEDSPVDASNSIELIKSFTFLN